MVCEPWTSRCSSWIWKRQRNQRSVCQYCWIVKKAKVQKNICFIDYTKAFDCVDHNKLWKILKEMGIPDHLTWLLRNPYACQEATVRTGYGTTDWFQIGKVVRQGYILSLCLFNLYAEYIMWNVRVDDAQTGIKTARKISITSDMQMTPPLWQNAKRNWRASDESERGKWKSWLKTQPSEN